MMGRTRAALGSVALVLAGCAKILGVNEGTLSADAGRGNGQTGADARPLHRDAGALFDSKLPYLTGRDCEDCVTANCGAEQTACNADERCLAWLDDIRAKPDPVSEYTRYLQQNAAQEQDGGVMALPYTDLRSCARNRCRTECELGRDFSCFGKFEWPATYPNETDIHVRVVQALNQSVGWPGMRVRACMDATCTYPLGDAVTDSQGFLDLAISRQRFDINTKYQYPEFNGFLLFDTGPVPGDAGTSLYPNILQGSRPFLSGNYGRFSMIPVGVMTPYFRLLGTAYDPSLAYYMVKPQDCRGDPAKGVVFEVWFLVGRVAQRCDAECSIYYTNDSSLVDQTLTSFSTLGQIAWAFAPVRQSIIIVRDEKTLRAVSMSSGVTLPGHIHDVALFPPAASQLAGFPAGEL